MTMPTILMDDRQSMTVQAIVQLFLIRQKSPIYLECLLSQTLQLSNICVYAETQIYV